jgi:hypothetical protein
VPPRIPCLPCSQESGTITWNFMRLVCDLVELLFSWTLLLQTSHERHKGRYRSSPNPYDRGVLRNIKDYLFESLPHPRVDFRAVAQPNLMDQQQHLPLTVHSGC